MAQYATMTFKILLVLVAVTYGQWDLGGDTQETATVHYLQVVDSIQIATGNIRFLGYGRLYFNDGTYISSADSLGAVTVSVSDDAVDSTKLAESSVQSSDINDGTIVNADINANAAISGTKINPNFGEQDIYLTGDIRLGSAGTDSTVIDGGDITATGTIRSAYLGIGVTPQTLAHIYTAGTTAAAQEALRLQGKYINNGSGPLLRFTNYNSGGTNPNTGEYNLAGIYAYDYDSEWGGALAFQTVASGTSGGGNLVTRLLILPNGNMTAGGGLTLKGHLALANAGDYGVLTIADSIDTPALNAENGYGIRIHSGSNTALLLGVTHATQRAVLQGVDPGTGWGVPILLNPINTAGCVMVGGNKTPLSTLEVNGGVVIGVDFAGVYAAPTNGLRMSGAMGIGGVTGTPLAMLHVDKTGDGVIAHFGRAAGASQETLISMSYRGDEQATTPPVSFGYKVDADSWTDHTKGAYVIKTRSTNNGNPIERFRVESDGSVNVVNAATNIIRTTPSAASDTSAVSLGFTAAGHGKVEVANATGSKLAFVGQQAATYNAAANEVWVSTGGAGADTLHWSIDGTNETYWIGAARQAKH